MKRLTDIMKDIELLKSRTVEEIAEIFQNLVTLVSLNKIDSFSMNITQDQPFGMKCKAFITIDVHLLIPSTLGKGFLKNAKDLIDYKIQLNNPQLGETLLEINNRFYAVNLYLGDAIPVNLNNPISTKSFFYSQCHREVPPFLKGIISI